MAGHHLKTWPQPFQALWDRRKPFEVRKNDREYAVGDRLVMQEWHMDSGTWGERIVSADVGYILHGGFGLQAGYVVMALTNMRNEYYEGDENDKAE